MLLSVSYLFLHSRGGVPVCQPGPAGKGPQHRQHWTHTAEKQNNSFNIPSFLPKHSLSLSHVGCWCPIVLPGIPPPRWWSGDSGSPGTKERKKKRKVSDQSSAVNSSCRVAPWLTISSRTLLDTATLNGWNLLMAEKADSSTSVCGSLEDRDRVQH